MSSTVQRCLHHSLGVGCFCCGKNGIPHWNTLISEEPEYSSNSNFNYGKVAKLRKRPVKV
jgi:hypothetical protein